MAILEQYFNDVKKAMVKPIIVLENEFKTIRGAKASPSMVENVRIEFDDGKQNHLKNISTISSPDARTIIISPWDPKHVSLIDKALLKENLNVTPANDGKVIKLIFPQLTEETRKDLTKSIKHKAEEAKIAIRNIRRESIEKLKKTLEDDEISEDEEKEAQVKTQDFTNKAIKKIDDMYKEKEHDIMTV